MWVTDVPFSCWFLFIVAFVLHVTTEFILLKSRFYFDLQFNCNLHDISFSWQFCLKTVYNSKILLLFDLSAHKMGFSFIQVIILIVSFLEQVSYENLYFKMYLECNVSTLIVGSIDITSENKIKYFAAYL